MVLPESGGQPPGSYAYESRVNYYTIRLCYYVVELSDGQNSNLRDVCWLYQVNSVMLGIAIYTMCRHAHTSVQGRQMKQKTLPQNIA